MDALAKWLGTHQEGLSKLVQVPADPNPNPKPNPNPNPNPKPDPHPNPNPHPDPSPDPHQVQNQLLDDLAVLQQLNG